MENLKQKIEVIRARLATVQMLVDEIQGLDDVEVSLSLNVGTDKKTVRMEGFKSIEFNLTANVVTEI